MTTRTLTEERLVYLLGFFFSAAPAAMFLIFGNPFYALAAAAALVLFTFFSMKPEWGIYALLLASVCTAISVEVGSLTIRPEQMVTVLLAGILFLFVISGKRRLVASSLDWLIVSYFLLNVLASILHAPDVRTSLRKCLLLFVTFSSYFVATQLVISKKVLTRIVSLMIGIGIVEAIYGIISVYLFVSGIDIGGAHAPYGDIYARGTFIEGNIFGSFQMIIGLILLSFLLSKHFKRWTVFILIALVLVLVSSIMSFTRAAWLGFLAGFFSYVFFIRRSIIGRVLNHIPIILLTFLLLVTLGFVLSATVHKGSVSLWDLYADRFQKILDTHSNSAMARMAVWKQSLEFWRRNPILGNGTDSIKALAVGTAMPMFGTDYWIPNSMILALHDTGIVGLMAFCAIQIVFLGKLWIAMRRIVSPYDQAVLEGFFAAFIGVQVAYFFSNAFWLIYIWVFMAVGISYARLAPKSSIEQSRY